ncbi:TIGR02302 family protein [Acuticoccus sp. MNP-M23]|uniref:TIGR02302 family protein n=1 Tax=Acuticoccus sp. MNP-M23 TaxID=3072793 RepID=UPI0028163D3F|nr:TIGR02302 family protein [Acuticoccus sp. MNP-M23]WMS43247.1 TIGR02302 family protein [Acuticoccus sp. MNP-M23]
MPAPMNTRLSRLITSARAAIVWERLWPAVAPMVGVLALFLATAWMGLWIGAPALLKGAALAVFAVLFVASGWRLRRLRMPGREDALRRLESDADLPHRPLGTYEDNLAPGGDEVTESLWRVHRRRAMARLSALRFAVPRPDIVPHDPFAVRAVVGIALFVGVVVGAGALAERLITPFNFDEPSTAAAGPQFRLDAWVTPPSYTGRAPLFLSSATRVETGDGIKVPAGSILTVRTQGGQPLDLHVAREDGATTETMPRLSDDGAEVAAYQSTLPIDGPMAVEVQRDDTTVDGWRFVAEGDRPPSAVLTEDPAENQRGGFELRYALDDDYGIASAEALLMPLQAGEGRRPLVDNPQFPLVLPAGPGMRGAARTVQDLSEHPFAGMEVTLRIKATDGVGQTASSAPRMFRLPSRVFINPVAKALVEQRQILALDANRQIDVIEAMDLMLLVPDALGGPGAFLAVRAAYTDMVAARTDDEMREMLDQLWALALMLEDNGMSEAERALAAAQERLRQAIEDGAPPEEIARLTQELREAMQRYMQALAEQAQQSPQQAMGENSQTITQNDLDKMLERIEQLAREGRTEEAEALLAELQQMMQNLQMAQRGQGQGGDPMGQNGRTLDELGRMIQRQQELMDETYGLGEGQEGQPGQQGQRGQGQQGQGQFGQGQGRMDQFGGQQGQPGQQGQRGGQGGQDPMAGMSPSERAEAMQRLQEQQQALREQLDEMMRQLEEQGFEPGERLGDAERSMGDAGEALGEGESGNAVGDQGEALQALREGAQGMAQQLAEAEGQGQGEGEQMGSPDSGPGRDPLGRARTEGGYADTSRVGIPDEIDTQRARRILQELRRRLGDLELPRLERNYLERLLP